MRSVSPVTEDRVEGVSDESCALIEKHGEFFEANTGEILLEREKTDEHLLIIVDG